MIRDFSDIKNSNVWENNTKTTQPQLNPPKRTIIVLGDHQTGNQSKKLGKTSLIKLIKGDFDL